MKGSAKIGMIMVVIILLIIALAIGGYFVYAKTDLLQSNQTLFVKYLGQALENLNYVENTQMTEIADLKEEMPYTMQGTLSCEIEGDTNENATILSNMKVNVQASVNKPEEKAYAKTTVRYQDQDLFTLEYANTDKIHALKSDEIVTAFVGIENENLKVFMQKLGMIDTSTIPNTIYPINLNNIFSITEEERAHILDTYSSVLIENIAQEKFSKDRNLTIRKEDVTYVATAYRLTLTEQELKEIEIALLQALQQDSITLNLLTTKAKLLGLDDNYTQVNKLTQVIQKQINTIQNGNTTLNEALNIAIYVDNGQVLTTEIIFENEIKYTIYGQTQENSTTRYLAIENLNVEAEYDTIEIHEEEIRNETESTTYITVNIDDTTQLEVAITNHGSVEEQFLETTYEVNLNQNEVSLGILYEQETTFEEENQDILEVDRTNCAVLNDYPTDQMQMLWQSIIQRIDTVLKEKKQLIGWKD